MKRLLLLALAGCASPPPVDRPARVSIRLEEDEAQVAKDRPILATLFGGEARSLGEIMREALEYELRSAGQKTLKEVSAEAEGLVVIRMKRWDLDAVGSAGQVTAEFEVVLYRTSDGAEIWAHRPGRRTVALQAGERRDISAFVQRLAIEALRSYP